MITLKDSQLRKAAHEGIDAFLGLIIEAIKEKSQHELNADTLSLLNGNQITLWAYDILRDEVMNGGFIQLIYNGYGPFIFDNPFAKAMRLWGLKDLSKLVYKAKELYDEHKGALTQEYSDEEFMALFEQYPQFDDLDDSFIENEEEYTERIARYVDEHLNDFISIEND